MDMSVYAFRSFRIIDEFILLCGLTDLFRLVTLLEGTVQQCILSRLTGSAKFVVERGFDVAVTAHWLG